MNDTNQQPQHPYYDDEISLVDLATTFIRRRRVFYAVFVVVIVIALLYALLSGAKEYSTLVQLAVEQTEEGKQPIEPSRTVLTTIDSYWYPALKAMHIETEGNELPFKIEASNPDDTALIKLVTKASPDLAETVGAMHRQLVNNIVERQNSLVSRNKRLLQQRLNSVENTLQQLTKKGVAGEAIAQAIQEKVNIEAELESLQSAEVLVVARQSQENAGVSKILILALGVVLGLMFGVFATFIAEFASQVREAMQKEA